MRISTTSLQVLVVASVRNASADFNGLRRLSSRSARARQHHGRHHHRGLQACMGLPKKDCGEGCDWVQGSCTPASSTPPPSPPTNGPTSPPSPSGPFDPCSEHTKGGTCNSAPGCEWTGGSTGCRTIATAPPTTAQPTSAPTTATPSSAPTSSPTASPTSTPTATPTAEPSSSPTASPTTATPTSEPTSQPTAEPTATAEPTLAPSSSPTSAPTSAPSASPTHEPSSSPTSSPTTSTPTSAPTSQPTDPPGTATYVPGDLTVSCDGGKLTLSTGLDCKRLTNAGQPVLYANGSQSSVNMHSVADGAAVIPHPTDGGWYYVSNSEAGSGGGGVGTLRFAANGDLVEYTRDLTGTSRNCGGGRTPWNTWVTCEENGSNGHCHEVDPYTKITQQVNVVSQGGNYESFAYDDQDPVSTRFFTTEDSSTGALTRYTPHTNVFLTDSKYDNLSSSGGVHEFLILASDGTFSWTTSLSAGRSNANQYFPSSEGIDVLDRILFFVSKTTKKLFTLDLAEQTWSESSTLSGAFNLQPDQIGRIVGEGDILYFCEDGGSDCDIHGRDATGQYFTIVRGDGYSTETTGLAFSPDGKYMYAAFQANSNIYSFWRTDGQPFNGTLADIKYH